jgi:hypothetical protein
MVSQHYYVALAPSKKDAALGLALNYTTVSNKPKTWFVEARGAGAASIAALAKTK